MTQQRKGLLAVIVMIALVLLSLGGIVKTVVTGITAVTVATSITPQPTQTLTPTPIVPALSVQGSQFRDMQGHLVTLVGASRPSFESLCHGDGHFTPADFQAMRGWGMNTVRISLSSEFWSNAGGTCPNYHEAVAEAVSNAEIAGLYVILTLQTTAPFDTTHDRLSGGANCPMPDTRKDLTLWRDLAHIYHTDQRVLLSVFSQPHDVTPAIWLDGGTLSNATCSVGDLQHNTLNEKGTYQALGMRDLVAAIRTISPLSIVIVSGADWGYDLNTVVQGNTLAGSNIAYSTNPFNATTKMPSTWTHDFGSIAQDHPVVVADSGSYDCNTNYLTTAIDYDTTHHLSWLAGIWNVGNCNGPNLLSGWAGSPNGTSGEFIRAHIRTINH